MRPQDILIPQPLPASAASPAISTSIPVRPVERALITHGHSDHARAGHGAVLATQETLDMMRLRYGDNFAGSTQAISLWRGDQARQTQVTVPSRRPCAGLGADRRHLQDTLHRRLGRLQGRRRSDLRAVRDWCPATCSSPRRRSACRCSATAMPQARSHKLLHSVEAVSRARASGRRLFARQGAARDRDAAAGRLRRADLSARRDGEDHPLLRKPRHRARRTAAGARTRRRPISPAPSRSRRLRQPRTCGRGAFPIRSPPLPRAGCGCAPAHGSAASNCRW